MAEATGAGLIGIGLLLLLAAAVGFFGVPIGKFSPFDIDIGPTLRDRRGQLMLTVFSVIFLIVGTVLVTSAITPMPPSGATLTATPTPTPRSTTVDRYPFYVYRDDGSPDNHFSFWDGIMEDGESIGWGSQIDYGYANNCHSGSTCMRIAYTPVGPKYWVGISWQHPQGNWGTKNEGFDLRKATRLTFWARGEKGRETVTFGMGGIGRKKGTCEPASPYPDSACPTVEISPTLSTTWQQYSIDLASKDLGHVIGGFLVTIGGGDAQTIYLDEIRYESGPQATMTATATATPTTSPTLTTTPTSTPTSTPTATPECPVTGATEEGTIRALVLAEADRVLEQDIEGVVALFDENALKWDKARNQSWQGRAQIRQYYEEAWRYIQYKQVLHTNIEVTITGTTAKARNDSSGTYIVRATGAEGKWNNPRGDSWTFVRGTDGCWLITSHRFNLSPEDP